MSWAGWRVVPVSELVQRITTLEAQLAAVRSLAHTWIAQAQALERGEYLCDDEAIPHVEQAATCADDILTALEDQPC